jgi:hypothetical protein
MLVHKEPFPTPEKIKKNSTKTTVNAFNEVKLVVARCPCVCHSHRDGGETALPAQTRIENVLLAKERSCSVVLRVIVDEDISVSELDGN